MNKAQALQSFWSSFDIPAYDETTVPDDATMPYITYEVATGALEQYITMTASIWYRSQSWKDITLKAEEVAQAIGYGGKLITLERGYLYIVKGTPFAQRMGDDNDSDIRRMILNIEAEYLTEY